MIDLSERFARLFEGRTDAIGTNAGGVVRREVTPFDYHEHLYGREPIGIFPMLDDDTCRFAAIDLDQPDFQLARALQSMIPGVSWIERSRSGNAHVWVFFKSPCEAWAARAILTGATEAVGRRDIEVFPKQDHLLDGMVGNYINLPLYGDQRPVLLPGDDGPISRERFLTSAILNRQDPDDWERRARRMGAEPPGERETETEWGESPRLHECASWIIEGAISGDRPLQPGARHQVLFHLAKQLLNYRDLDRYEAMSLLHDVNVASSSPLPSSEVRRAFSNAERGQFTSTGCDDPLMSPYIRDDCPIGNP